MIGEAGNRHSAVPAALANAHCLKDDGEDFGDRGQGENESGIKHQLPSGYVRCALEPDLQVFPF